MTKITLPRCVSRDKTGRCLNGEQEDYTFCDTVLHKPGDTCPHYTPESGLGGLKWAVREVGAELFTAFRPTEGEPDIVAEIQYAESVAERCMARGETDEATAVAVINKWNEEAEDAE